MRPGGIVRLEPLSPMMLLAIICESSTAGTGPVLTSTQATVAQAFLNVVPAADQARASAGSGSRASRLLGIAGIAGIVGIAGNGAQHG